MGSAAPNKVSAGTHTKSIGSTTTPPPKAVVAPAKQPALQLPVRGSSSANVVNSGTALRAKHSEAEIKNIKKAEGEKQEQEQKESEKKKKEERDRKASGSKPKNGRKKL
jgi:hypothetical protein